MPAYKYKLKDGKTTLWYANFYVTDWTGNKRHICKRGFKTQREAKEYEKNYLEQSEGRSDITFDSLVKCYMDDMKHRLKASTVENKEFLIYTHLTPYFGKLKISNIDSLKVRKWQNELLEKEYSPTYLRTINNQLSAILNYACAHYGLRANPCKAAGSMGKSKASEMNIWTQEEYEQFADSLKKKSMRVAFDTLFYSGMRVGELLALTPADILPDHKIRIEKTFVVVKGEQFIQTTKTEKSNRTIDIPEFLCKEITEYISKLYGIRDDDRIFMFTRSALTKGMERAAKRAGLDKIRIHDLRHSHASLLISMGYSIKQISERLGHESVKTTLDTYAHIYPEAGKELAEGLNKLRLQKSEG